MGEGSTWEDLTAEINALYEEGRYAGIDAIIDANAHRFPDKIEPITYTRLCIKALQGETAAAITLFDTVTAGGVWFPASRLRGDPDLASLQGNPDFERLAAVSLLREQAIQSAVKPAMTVCYPPSPPHDTKTYPALIALHGNNTTAAQTQPFWEPATTRGLLVALLQSSQPSGADKFVWDDAAKAEQEVSDHFALLQRDHPADRDSLVIGGFSMGGGVACRMALSGKVPVRGFIGVAPWLRGFEVWEPQIDAAVACGLRAFLIVGDKDPGCYKDTLALHAMLEAHGMPCKLRVTPGGRHTYPPDFDAALSEALDFILE